jgi:hypothetical protein
MAQQKMAEQASLSRTIARGDAWPEISMRLVGALLALAIAAVHVADQGGVTVLNSPAWMGWAFRLIEVGGVLTALVLLVPRPAWLGPAWLGPAWLGWAAAAALGAGPFTGYVTSRTVGLPGDPGDVGNWGYWVGTVSLFAEAALVVLSVSVLLALRRRSAQ